MEIIKRKIAFPQRTKDNSLLRDSNGELLRLLCMFFVVMHHFLVHAVFPDTMDFSVSLDAGIICSTFLNGFLYVAVNCFILISGYYGIKLSIKSFWRIFSICAFYGLLLYVVQAWINHEPIVFRTMISQSILILSHSQWWFVNCYIMLMCISPVLNAGLAHMDKRQHLILIAVLTVTQVYMGYYRQTPLYDADGYTAYNMVYIYIIGRYIHSYVQLATINRRFYVFGYCTSAVIWAGMSCLSHLHRLGRFWEGFSYNNPIVIWAAISFFCWMMSYSFKSKIINRLATGAFAVYLVQESSRFSELIYSNCISFTNGLSLPSKLMLVAFISSFFFISVLLFDKIRYVVCNPLDIKIVRYLSQIKILRQHE